MDHKVFFNYIIPPKNRLFDNNNLIKIYDASINYSGENEGVLYNLVQFLAHFCSIKHGSSNNAYSYIQCGITFEKFEKCWFCLYFDFILSVRIVSKIKIKTEI